MPFIMITDSRVKAEKLDSLLKIRVPHPPLQGRKWQQHGKWLSKSIQPFQHPVFARKRWVTYDQIPMVRFIAKEILTFFQGASYHRKPQLCKSLVKRRPLLIKWQPYSLVLWQIRYNRVHRIIRRIKFIVFFIRG